MQQVQLSYSSSEFNATNVQFLEQRRGLSIQESQPKITDGLNAQQRQVIDDVGISQKAVDKLREAQELINQLQQYLDYLYGREGDPSIQIKPAEDRPNVEIFGRSTTLAASVTVATYLEETVDLTANFDDNGNLSSLSISKTSIKAQYVQASYILEDTQFYTRG